MSSFSSPRSESPRKHRTNEMSIPEKRFFVEKASKPNEEEEVFCH